MKKIKKEEKIEDSKAVLKNLLADLNEARREMFKEKEKTLSLINNFPDGLIVLDNRERIEKINLKTEEIFSIKAKRAEGKRIQDLKENILFSKLAKLILNEQGKIKEIERLEFPIKENITLEIRIIPMIHKGEREGYLLILHDISRQKLVEKLKTEFVTLSAHQLRTPLSGIKWNLKMMIEGSFGELTKEQKEFLSRAYQNNERMIKLVNDLLDATKIEEGRYLFYVKKENILEIIQQVIESLKNRIKAKNLQFKFIKPKEQIVLVEADREKIAICVQNYLTNAINYTPNGGKLIVNLKYDREKREAIFSVKDTGMGIPKNEQKRIFTKFYRSTQAMKAEAVGSGLGLYMTKNIIEAHKGRVWFKSREGKGSIFYFSLPTIE